MRENTISQRLNIIKGQIEGLMHLIESEANCKKVTTQFYAINSALKKTITLYFKENFAACLNSIDLGKGQEKLDFLLEAIIKNK